MSLEGPSRKRRREVRQPQGVVEQLWQNSNEFSLFDYSLSYMFGLPTRNDIRTSLHAAVCYSTPEHVSALFFSPHRIDGVRAYFKGVTAETCRKERIQFFINNQDFRGNTALHLAAMMGRSDMATMLVQNGADSQITNHQGLTAAQLAYGRGHKVLAYSLGFVEIVEDVVNVVQSVLSGAQIVAGVLWNSFRAPGNSPESGSSSSSIEPPAASEDDNPRPTKRRREDTPS